MYYRAERDQAKGGRTYLGIQSEIQNLNRLIDFQIPDEQNKEWFIVALLPHIRVSLMQQNIASQFEVLEIAMKLESTPMGKSSSCMSQILSQLTILSMQVEDMKKYKGKDKREDIWCVICRS
jgi:hypothetical protein